MISVGEMLSLGGEDGSVSALAGLVQLRGPLASLSRKAVYAARMPTPAQAARVGASWALDAALGAAALVARGAGGAAGKGRPRARAPHTELLELKSLPALS